MAEVKPFEQRVMEEIDGFAASFLADIEVQLDGSNFGAHELTDEQFVLWFNEKMRADPNWARALVFVQGGPEELHRYAQIVEGVM